MEVPFEMLQAVVKGVLTQPQAFEWSAQGFGMLRTYFGDDKQYRLNIWDSTLAVPLCSLIHDHPWHFQSWVICGDFFNQRYNEVEEGEGLCYLSQKIQTGFDGGPTEMPQRTWLMPQAMELYKPGQSYRQASSEIHASFYTDGTVTINDRNRLEDSEHARVFYPEGQAWVDAMPRKAAEFEVWRSTTRALRRLDEC